MNLLLFKQRQNPFNTDVIASHSFENKDRQLLDGAVDQTPTQNEGQFPYVNSFCAVWNSYCECEWIS